MFTELKSLEDAAIERLPERSLIFIHTPMCGTCKVARKMLEVVREIRPELEIYEVNANYVPQKLHEWKIRSVPALLYMNKSQDTVTVQYAMADVPSLLERVQRFFA